VLIDSTLPKLVYDDQSQTQGRTNADDITDAIDDLRIQITKETTSLAWYREEQVLKLDPDLIVIHLSAFYDQTNPRDSDRKLDGFLRYMANSRAKFIIYSRAADEDREDVEGLVNFVESKIPQLQKRVWYLPIPGGQKASFRDKNTKRELKLLVKQVLQLS